jgi:fumarate reductase subunit C
MSVQSDQVGLQIRLWVAQRLSAGVLAVCVVIHLITIFYAMRSGLSAAEILGRTRGNFVFAVFYFVFVVSAAVHAPIGLMRIAQEWFSWRGRLLNLCCLILGIFMLLAGMVAVWSLYAAK